MLVRSAGFVARATVARYSRQRSGALQRWRRSIGMEQVLPAPVSQKEEPLDRVPVPLFPRVPRSKFAGVTPAMVPAGLHRGTTTRQSAPTQTVRPGTRHILSDESPARAPLLRRAPTAPSRKAILCSRHGPSLNRD